VGFGNPRLESLLAAQPAGVGLEVCAIRSTGCAFSNSDQTAADVYRFFAALSPAFPKYNVVQYSNSSPSPTLAVQKGAGKASNSMEFDDFSSAAGGQKRDLHPRGYGTSSQRGKATEFIAITTTRGPECTHVGTETTLGPGGKGGVMQGIYGTS